MRLIYGLILVIVGLTAALVHQESARRKAEANARLAWRPFETAEAARARPDNGGLSAVVEALLKENRALRETRDSTKSAPSQSGAKVAALRDVIARLPEQGIPELQFATEADWYVAADGPLETADDFRQALSRLRGAAEKRFALKAQGALAVYMRDHNGAFPGNAIELTPHFEGGIDQDVLRRYHIVAADKFPKVRVGGQWALTQGALVDSKYDSRLIIGPNGYGGGR